MLVIKTKEKISKYAICLPINDKECNYIYLNGCYGEFVVVPREIGELICKKDSDITTDFLRNIHYIIPADENEEQLISQTCHDKQKVEKQYFNFSLIPTYSCNFHCTYCFEKDISVKYPDWLKSNLTQKDVDSIFKYADYLIENGRKFFNVRLFGGEPLLPKNKEIIEYIAGKCLKYDIPIQTITNGYYIDQYIDVFERYRFDEFKITIDGTADMHDRRRAPSNTHKSFDKIISNVGMLLNHNKKVTLRTNVNRENIDHIHKLIKQYHELGLSENPNLNYYFKSTISCFEKPENAVSDLDIMECIGNKIENYIFNSTYFRIYNQIQALIQKNKNLYFKPTYCGASNGNYMFDPNGNIFSCWDIVTEPQSMIGKINNEEVIFNPQFQVWQNRVIDKIEKCRECSYKMFCGGGCAAQALVVKGNLNDSFCDEFIKVFNQIAITVAKTNMKNK